MTNITYSKDAIINIYVANLAEYNKGKLVGSWVSLPIEENDWKDFLKTIGNPEEFVIHDYESNSGFDSLEIEYYSSISDLNKLARKLEEIKTKGLINEFNALYEVLEEDFEDAVEYLETNSYLFYSGATREEVAKSYMKIHCTIPKYLENYIDYKEFANDMDLWGLYTKTSYGIIAIF